MPTSEVALAWVLSRGPDVVPIPGTRRVAYLESNVNSAALTLNDQDLVELDGLSSDVVGDRYPDMSGIGR